MQQTRCSWSGKDPLYIKYHDEEWGVPVFDDRRLFEFITLEGAQAGLNWLTILKRRKGYSEAFDGFDVLKIARYSESKIQSLLENPGIIRNRLKVRSTVKNAQAFLKIQEEFGTFSNFLWQFVEGTPIRNNRNKVEEIPASTPLSDNLSKELKRRGFSFVGSTIMYAYMQAIGMVNDHAKKCFRYNEI